MLVAHHRDDLDRGILFSLQENARISTSLIAKSLNVARSTVHERITRLEREGIIQGYTAVIKPDPNERSIHALLYLELERNHSGIVIKQLQEFPEIISCSALTGEFNLFCTVEAPLLEDLDALLEEISILPHVIRTKSNVILANKFDRAGTTQIQNERPYLHAVGA
ncbi:Lrp/AsnC family transcriptional regulator [Kiloniella sp.]|uniref:Lrp/AsnC family transcriptional regulator n=1 Tax=Kiloniella sp. TaxID=1938587 RepID=UPI003B0225C1